MIIVPQSPYLTDLVLADFTIFWNLKAPLKGRHFYTRDEIITEMDQALGALNKRRSQKVFEERPKVGNCVLLRRGDYFEADPVE